VQETKLSANPRLPTYLRLSSGVEIVSGIKRLNGDLAFTVFTAENGTQKNYYPKHGIFRPSPRAVRCFDPIKLDRNGEEEEYVAFLHL